MPAQVPREVVETFARRLHDALLEKGMSQSDLARAVWGTTEDPRGFEVAKNRDRVSQYLKGRSLPDRENAQKIASVLGIEVDDLVPPRGSSIDDEKPEVSMKALAGHSDKVRLTVNKTISFGLAAQIIALLAGYDEDT